MTTMPLLPGVSGTARFSEDGRYRYMLRRWWQGGGRAAIFIGLNPSKAGSDVDDLTIRKCIGFATTWGCSEIVMLNLFGLIATDPEELFTSLDPVGRENEYWVDQTLALYGDDAKLIAAWGAHPMAETRGCKLEYALRPRKMMCLGKTKDGSPRHPSRIAYATALEPFRGGSL